MSKNMKIPQLRFKEFSGEWEEKQLGNIATFSKGKGISKADIDENGELECIRYGQLYTHYNELIKDIISKTNIEKSELVLSESGDIIIPASGETQIDIATASCVLKDNVALGGDLNIIKSKEDGVFLSYYLNNTKKIDIARLSQGISVVHLYSNQLKTLKLNLPSKQEQEKIASFLTQVDTKIEQLTKKGKLLSDYKKGIMQKIFSQEIRFQDEDGKDYPKWEEKKLEDLAIKKNIKNKNTLIKTVFTNSAEFGIVNQQDYFDKDIANQNNLDGYYVVEKDDFVYNPRISSFAPVGPMKRNKIGQGVMSPLYIVLEIEEDYRDFYEFYFETTLWYRYMNQIANYGVRHDRMNITNSDLLKMPLPFPCLGEQIKIASFLSSINEKIEEEQKILDKTKKFKTGLLQQMFV